MKRLSLGEAAALVCSEDTLAVPLGPGEPSLVGTKVSSSERT
jgi:hypothetical protein